MDEQQPPTDSFVLKLDSAKVLHAIFSSVGDGRKDQLAAVTVNDAGVRVCIENSSKSAQAIAYVRSDCFQEFVVSEASTFRVNVFLLLECIQVFGVANLDLTSLTMAFSAQTSLVRLLLEDHGVVTECELATNDAVDELDFPAIFREHEVLCRMVVQSDGLNEAIHDVADVPGATRCTIAVEPGAAVVISTAGSCGRCDISISRSSDIFVSLQADSTLCFTYSLVAVLMALKPLSHAQETLLRINAEGMLSLNHKLVLPDAKTAYINMVLLADDVIGDEVPGDAQHAGAAEGGLDYEVDP